MKKIRSKRDYYIYVYGLDVAGIDYETSESNHEISIPSEISITEVEIMKDQLLSDGVFSIRKGRDINMPVPYDIIGEVEQYNIYKVDDPQNAIFTGTNPHTFINAI